MVPMASRPMTIQTKVPTPIVPQAKGDIEIQQRPGV